jgi:hypothetical protein
VSNGVLMLTRPPAPNRPPVANAGPDVTQVNDPFILLQGSATDPDNHLLEFTWTGPDGDIGGLLHPPSLCFDEFSPGTFTYTLTVDDGHGGVDEDSVLYTLESTTVEPSVQILRPTEGEIVPAGVPYTIRWSATDDFGISGIEVRAFVGGSTAFLIPECVGLPATATECTWRNPPPSESASIIVTATDTHGNSGAASVGFVISGGTPPGSLPAPWTSADIGAVAAAGSVTFADGRFTVRGSGADIWNTADELHYAYRAESFVFNFEITARIDSVQNLHRWVKAGLMIRESTAPGSRHASLFVTPTTERGIAFQRRTAIGGPSVHTSGPSLTAPVWLKLTRAGDVFRGFYRKELTDPWTFIGQETLTDFPATSLVGLAVSSHVDGRLATATFSEVAFEALPNWSVVSIGGSNADATFDNTRFSIDGSGADIWGTSDAFTLVRGSFLSSNMVFTARVLNIENTHRWAKAGVMIRGTLDADSAHVMVIVSPGQGIAMQWRAATGGVTMSTAPVAGTAPAWVRIDRVSGTYTGYTSSDGVTWIPLGSVSIPDPSYIGLAVTSHNATAIATGVFDDVKVQVR